MPRKADRAFRDLLRDLSGYLDDLSFYSHDASQSLLSRLPLELRELVYEHHFRPHTESGTCLSWYILTSFVNFPVMRVNESTRIDAGLWLIRTRPFYIENQPAQDQVLLDFLESMPNEQGFEHIRNLKFWRFSDCVPSRGGDGAVKENENIALMQRCTGLRNVTLRWELLHLHRDLAFSDSVANVERSVYYGMNFLSVEQLIRRYRLDGLLVLGNVREVTLSLYTTAFFDRGTQDLIEHLDRAVVVLDEVCAWFRERFREQGREVVVKCEDVGPRWY